MNSTIISGLCCLLAPCALALSPGDIAVIGYNASGSPDSIALLVLTDLTEGTTFFVCDNEVSSAGGASFADTNEAEATFTVQAGQTVPAGTVLILPWGNQAVSSSVYTWTGHTSGGLGASVGTLLDDGIYIYTGASATSTPTAFIFGVVGASAGSSGGQRPSGLVAGETFIQPSANQARYKTAGATYSGTQSELLTAIGNTATNWEAVTPGATTDWTFTVGGGAPTNTLTLSVSPAAFSESATNPAATGTVTRSEVTASDLEVTLSSPDAGEVTVPATVTILANQASANFDVTAVDDSLPDGDQVVTLTASAPSSTSDDFEVTVQDDGDTLPPTALQTGDIAFTAFNGDRDAIAFVALDTIPEGEVIYFTDNEWNGSAIGAGGAFNTGEGLMTWTSPSGGVTAGTVVVIDNYDTATPNPSVGTATPSGDTGLNATNETVYAFQGLSGTQPGTFLALIANHGADSIANTGLTAGTTAIYLTNSADFADYTGPRNNQAAFADYLPLIGDVATNWMVDVGGAGGAVIPDSTAFSLGTPGSTTVEIAATASVSEGSSGSTPLTFAVTRSLDSTGFSVDYAITGGTATSGTDFTPLASGTLTFPAFSGPLTQNITVDVLGDEVVEADETIIITLSNLVQTTGTTSLGNVTGTGTITNDDSLPSYPASGSLTTTVKSSITLGGAEIPAFDPLSKRAFASSNAGIQVVDLTDAAAPVQLATIVPSSLGVIGLTSNDVSSIAVRKGTGGNPSILAAAIINSPKTANGHVVFLDAATGALLGSAEVGAVPDHIAFTPDGSKLLVCNEGELNGSAANIATETVPGTVSIVDLTSIASPGVTTAGFASFNASAAALKAAGVRIFDGGIPEFDFEPEYLAISPDGTEAMVTLQEANAVAILDIASATFTSIVPLGEKDFSSLYADFSDQDGGKNPTLGNPVFGLYMPDAIASYQVGGQTYYVIANEGDDRDDFLNPDETIRVGNAGYDLDNSAFPDEATLKNNARLGRLTVSNSTGLRGDTEPTDGDIDRILKLGGRSFSILDSNGTQVYDSGDMIELIVANQFPALFDDSRSDNKGPEPEGVTVAKIGARTFAFVGLERSHMTLAFDVTNPLSPSYATAFQRTGDLNPEGMVVIQAADSPSGKPLLLVSNEVSNTLTTFEVNQATDFTLQLLHLADAEAGLLASQTAPNLAALVDAFDGTYPNTLILAGGDNYIPGPFAAAGTDASVAATHTRGNNPFAADIEIHNRIGVEASTVGNHEFDFGTNAFSDAINDTTFPYLSSNLDFSGDSGISGRYQETVGVGGLEEASSVAKKVVPSCVVTKGTEKIGLVGVTTQILEGISSTGGVEVKGFAGDGSETNDMALLATQVQPVIDDLKSQGVNKIVLMAHLQQITFEQSLAPLLTDVDIILAAGSNTRLGDSNDVAVAFTGHAADFAGNYPIYTAGADGRPTVIVNTDNEFTYLGRLVVDFDADGVIIVPNLTANTAENGAYAATAANVAAAWGVAEVDLPTTAFASGTKGALVKQITDAVQGVITVKDGDIRGYTDVYLEGERNFVRNQETNLGDISADSMVFVGQAALPGAAHVVALKNGGGIRASIGAVEVGSGAKVPPLANPGAGKPSGAISLLDIENSMRFNNGLMLCDTTPAGLKAILEHGVANAGTGNGRFPQIGGVRFSYVPTAAAGSRIQNIAIIDENDDITAWIVEDGAVSPAAPATITLVTLNFLANGGDTYPIKANAENFRYLLNDGSLSAPVDESLDYVTSAPVNLLGEQAAMGNYLQDRYATPATAYDIADTAPALDTRIQSTAVRSDTVFEGPATFGAWLAQNGYSSAGINEDSDADGITDLVEYFFNQSPNSGADRGNLPVITTAADERFLSFVLNANAAGVTGTLEVSDDLGASDPWAAAVEGVDYEVVSAVSADGETTYTLKLLGSSARAFWRHEVTE